MWIEKFSIENIRCFEEISLKFTKTRNEPYRWITFLSENGGGKSTALQALGLLLAGPEGAKTLLPRPEGWLRDEKKYGKISIRIHQDDKDPGQFGTERVGRAFGYSYFITGSETIKVGSKMYNEPTIGEFQQRRLTWLRQNAFKPKGEGWFAVGYGAFRRLIRSSQIIIPSLEPQARYTNFTTQINEDEPISTFERWMVYLDYRIHKSQNKDLKSKRLMKLGIDAINEMLPEGVDFDSVTSEGRILFNANGQKVPTIAMSDGYRSILALSGDLIWRLIQAFPNSDNPLKEEGVVLIDELDIHLHPTWQREIAIWLQEQFPKLQFIVATHSPFIAGGAGKDALTLKFDIKEGKSVVVPVTDDISAYNVDNILKSKAFEVVSTFSPQTQLKIDRYDELNRRRDRLNDKEKKDLDQLSLELREARPFGGPPEPGSLEDKMEKYLEKKLSD